MLTDLGYRPASMLVTFPTPLDDDSEDVHWALTTAQSLHARGDYQEALRWLRKAVAAAVNSGNNTRAVELGRHATDFEQSMVAASTERGARGGSLGEERATGQSAGAEAHGGPSPHDTIAEGSFDLDQPTYVESSRAPFDASTGPSTVVDRHIADDDTLHEGAIPAGAIQRPADSEITLVPFTQKAAGVGSDRGYHSGVAKVRRRTEPSANAVLSETLGAAQRPPLDHGDTVAETGPQPSYRLEDGEEHTLAMRVPPNVDDISSQREPHDEVSLSRTMPQGKGATRWRVAMLASPDGHDPRVMLLRPGTSAPAGAGVAMLIPASNEDAGLIAHLLGAHKR